MTIISHKQALLFPNPDGGAAVRVAPRSVLQQVPNWVRDTETFRHALKAGLIAEVAPAPVVVAVPPAEKMPPTIAELIAAGNSREAAAKIFEEEVQKWLAAGLPLSEFPAAPASTDEPAAVQGGEKKKR